MEEPVLKSEKSISTLLGAILIPIISIFVINWFLSFNDWIGYSSSIALVIFNGYLILKYLTIPSYTFYNEYFEIKNSFKSETEKVYYKDLADLNLRTDIYKDPNFKGISPLQGDSQNEKLLLVLKTSKQILLQEYRYDNFKLIRKLFTELSEKEDTSRLD